MSSSQILLVYDAIKAISVTAGGLTPTVKDLDELPISMTNPDLPVRLLLPFGAFQEGSQSLTTTHITLGGKMNRVTWQVRDLCLWRNVTQGLGLEDVADVLIEYCGAYATAITTNGRALSTTTQAHINGLTIAAGVYEYPEQSGLWYMGINTIIGVEEFIS